MREVFIGVIVKEWVAMHNERINFSQCNKVLVDHVVSLYGMCWNKRCEVLHNPEVQKQYLINEIKAIKEEGRRGVIANYNNHVNVHPISEEIETTQKVVSQVKSTKVFKTSDKKVGKKKSETYY